MEERGGIEDSLALIIMSLQLAHGAHYDSSGG